MFSFRCKSKLVMGKVAIMSLRGTFKHLEMLVQFHRCPSNQHKCVCWPIGLFKSHDIIIWASLHGLGGR